MEVADIVDWINWETDIDASATKDHVYRHNNGAWVRRLGADRRQIAGDLVREITRFEIILNDATASTIDTLMDALQDITNLPVVTEDFEDALGGSWTKQNSNRNNGASYTGDYSYLLTGSGGESNLLYTLPVTDVRHTVSFHAMWSTGVQIIRFFVQSLAGAGFYIDSSVNVKWYDGSSLEDLNVDMTEDTWHKFELRYIDLENYTMDLLFDDELLLEDADWSSTGLSTITTFKWNAGATAGTQNMYVDDISITYENDAFFKPVLSMTNENVPSRSEGKHANYRWRILLESEEID